MKRVLIESPYAGTPLEVARNIQYAKLCVHDSLARGEAPYASHLFFTQPGILDDTILYERRQGIEAGLAWGEAADLTAVYTDFGITLGMEEGIKRAIRETRPYEHRTIPHLPTLLTTVTKGQAPK